MLFYCLVFLGENLEVALNLQEFLSTLETIPFSFEYLSCVLLYQMRKFWESKEKLHLIAVWLEKDPSKTSFIVDDVALAIETLFSMIPLSNREWL